MGHSSTPHTDTAVAYERCWWTRMTESFCVSNARDKFGRRSTRDSPAAAISLRLSYLTLSSPPSSPSSSARAHLMVAVRGADRCGPPPHRTSERDFGLIATPLTRLSVLSAHARPLLSLLKFSFFLLRRRRGCIRFTSHRASLNFRR